ncbi:MAG TPA: hypothetical protein VMR59_02180 [Patescibacteria group bacterium]|jgi:hypothetical protein|nr:hypothetical protein [Patescibacteria group bacterium]
MAEADKDGSQKTTIDPAIVAKLEELVAGAIASPKPLNSRSPLEAFKNAAVPAREFGEVVAVQSFVDVAALNQGDLVWWRDDAGKTGYFLISTPVEGQKYATGLARFIDYEGKLFEGEATFQGATMGTSLNENKVSKNLRVEVSIPGRALPEDFTNLTDADVKAHIPTQKLSGVVRQIGIIPATSIAAGLA